MWGAAITPNLEIIQRFKNRFQKLRGTRMFLINNSS